MEDSTVRGEHMSSEVFDQALDFTERAESKAWSVGIPPLILISGGECSEHPDLISYLDRVSDRHWIPIMITNGMWLENRDLAAEILKPDRAIMVQVTHDPRFYPRAPPACSDPRVTFVPSLTHLVPLGRALRKRGLADMGLPLKEYPSSFNLRSATRHLGSFEQALVLLRGNAAKGKSGHCSPAISDNGDVVAGETRSCWKIGTVWSTMDEITQALISMGRCNRCGLEDNLSLQHKRSIGLSSLYGANE
jgi:MoaA/NifB/PqqE/SkfB family radical SAM enzyme